MNTQGLQVIFPELVKHNGKEDDYRIDYIGLIPVLMEAMKEQCYKRSKLQK